MSSANKAAPRVRLRRAEQSAPAEVTVRMYRHGLGDCFLIRLPKDGGGTFNILIDCGLIGVAAAPKQQMKEVLNDLRETCKNRLDLVVMTHEHWDHVSGFSKQQTQAEFASFDIAEVWYAWTEDPKNPLGRKLREERAAKLRALNTAFGAMRVGNSPVAASRADRLESILGFFGGPELGVSDLNAAPGGRTRLAFDYPGSRAGVRRRFCHPKDAPVSFPGVTGVRAYVLGPPEDEGLIKRSAPTRRGQEAYEFSTDKIAVDHLAAAFQRLGVGPGGECDGRDCPFDMNFARRTDAGGVPEGASAHLENLFRNSWSPESEKWRQIDMDWTQSAESLALNLDSHTNNTCLVVAIELIDSGKVLLFAADAQVGNWLSWQGTQWLVGVGENARQVTGPDLLRRVVFYKVGHHGSHNATLRTLGLELMESEELVAFVPVFKDQAEKNRWHAMPFGPLVRRLQEKTGGRLVLSDKAVESPGDPELARLTPAAKGAFAARLKSDPEKLYYEYSISFQRQ